MKKIVVGSLALCFALLVGTGVASACKKGHGEHGGHAGKSMKIVSANKDGVTIQFTSEAGDAEAVAALQKKFAEKVEKYNKGEAPCAKCKACPFKVAGLTLAATNIEKGVEIKATGDAAKLKAFAKAARMHHKLGKGKHGHHGKGHACKHDKGGAAGEGGGCGCGKKAAEPKADEAKPVEKKADEKPAEKKAE